MNEHRLSIIIVTYNNQKEIPECLNSIKDTLTDFLVELIIVDNNSTDQTLKLIKRTLAAFDKNRFDCRVVHNPQNRGFAKACNQGLKDCRGEYILLLNPDTRLLPGSVSRMVKFLGDHPQAGLVAPQLLYPDGKTQPSCRRFPTYWNILTNRWKMRDFNHRNVREVDQPQGACLLTSRRAFEQVGLLDERFEMFFNDVDWCRRFKGKGWKIYFYPEAKVIHKKGASVYPNRERMIFSSHRALYRYFNKYYDFKILNLVAGLILMMTAVFRVFFERGFSRHIRQSEDSP